MKTIPYNDSSVSLRLEFPEEWDHPSITGVNIAILDTDGDALLSSTAATLYTATTLLGAVSSGDSTIKLADAAADVEAGDVLHIADPTEHVEVLYYDTSTNTATLRTPLYFDHDNGATVSPQWATYTLDTSDTDTWGLGKECVIQWTATGIYNGTRYEFAMVKDREYSATDFVRRFRIMYPAEADAAGSRLDELKRESTTHVKALLRARGLDLDMVTDVEIIDQLIMAHCRWIIASQGGDSQQYEREQAWDDYIRIEQVVTTSPVWEDSDMDDSRDDGETDDHVPQSFARSF